MTRIIIVLLQGYQRSKNYSYCFFFPVPPTPTLGTVEEVSGGIWVNWTIGQGQLGKIIVTLRTPGDGVVTHNVMISGNSPSSTTVAASKLVKGQTYTVSLKAESNGVQSVSSGTKTVTLSKY